LYFIVEQPSISQLKVHLQRLDSMMPYVCDECQKFFCTTQQLKRPGAIHSDFKGFCCGLCGKDFKRPTSVRKEKGKEADLYSADCQHLDH